MPFDVFAVANYLLDKADADGRPLDHLQLQQLAILTHGWHLAIMGEPLCYERVEAWPDGPTIPALYHEFRPWGREPITDRVLTVDFDTWDETPYSLIRAGAGERTLEVIDRVWERYGRYPGDRLAAMTREPGSPWDQVAKRANTDAPRGLVIPNELLQEYYTRVALESRRQRVG